MAEYNDRSTWEQEDAYWRTNYNSRPYASQQNYDYYQPGYRFGYDAAQRYRDRNWNDVEPELSRSWNSYEYRGNSTWEQMKHAVRDAWDRITGKRTVGAH
jgi:hypothetical protein